VRIAAVEIEAPAKASGVGSEVSTGVEADLQAALRAAEDPVLQQRARSVPVVLVSYNTPELLYGVLASLRAHYPHNPVHVVDGSDAGPLATIREICAGVPGVALHAMGFNIHHGPGMAWALQNLNLTGPVLFLDTDIVVQRAGFIEAMLEILRPSDYGVGGVAHVNDEGFDIPYGYAAVPYLHPPCMLCNTEVMRQWPLPVKHGAPMVQAMKALHQAGRSGLLRHLNWVFEDIDSRTSARHFIHHIGKGTSDATGGYHLEEWLAEVMARRSAVGRPAARNERHNPDLLTFIPPGVKRVIEVGCSTGVLAGAFRALHVGHSGLHWHGIEIEARAAKLAQAHCDSVEVLDIETLNDAAFARYSDRDCWVFGDVLEHLRDPWGLLARICAQLPPGGCVVVCVPNVQHWSVQAQLAVGDFRYQASGLMDRTHLRWFTRLTLLEMVQQAGLKMEAGMARIFDEPQRGLYLPAIRAMALARGVDPEQAVKDALPLQYVLRAVVA
jgi:2-polyprenyl-3-methyl-5-hydroxy-6-metoxy-1,4-benzoquinol methylase